MYSVLFLILLVCFSACTEGNQKKENNKLDFSEKTQSIDKFSFPFPVIPVMLTQPEDRKAYLLQHYWDKFNFADTALVNNREVTEQAFANLLSLLADETTAAGLVEESMDNFCSGMEQHEHARKVCMQMTDDYLYNPNSPYYNEKLYAVYLKRMLQSKEVDEASKSSLQFRLTLISRNVPGSKASDFAYFLPDGSRHTLARTKVSNNRLLLVFYDPECPSCHETMRRMTADATLAAAVDAGQLTVLAVYTEGNEEAWRKSLADIPEGWIVGQDRQAVKDGALYDLKAMPSLYLLDGEKKVLLKDAAFDEILKNISSL